MRKALPRPCKIWTGALNNKGYGQTSVRVPTPRGHKTVYVHRLTWERERGPIPEGMCVCHRCDTPACHEITHLFLGTKADNNRDMRDKGRHNVASAHMAARKVTDEQVAEMRARWNSGTASQRQLASEYGLESSYVNRLVRGVYRSK